MGDRILYVEDNLRNRVLVKRVLMIEDFEVDEAEDGASGFQKATSDDYDLILMDINLPDIDGYEVTRKLRSAEIITPIVALTANAMVGDEQKALAAGCDGYITKPIDIDQLPVSVRTFIEMGRTRKVEQTNAPAALPDATLAEANKSTEASQVMKSTKLEDNKANKSADPKPEAKQETKTTSD